MTIRTHIARLWREAQRLYAYLLPIRFSFLALIVITFALLLSAQGYDIIAHIAEDDPTGALPPHTWQRIGFVAGFIFLALQVWYCSRRMLRAERPEGAPLASEYPWLTEWLPRILGALALVIGIAALMRVDRNYGGGDPDLELHRLELALVVALIAFVAFTVIRARMMGDGEPKNGDRRKPLTKIVFALTLIAAAGLFIWSTFFVQSTVRIGSAAVVLLAFALLVPVGSLLVRTGTRNRVPVLTLLIVWAFLISPFADNHVIETLPGNADARPNVATAFDRWFERLQSQSGPGADGRYPVILVATEGGGIRAAYWTAAVLTSLADTVPTFAEHTFAISAVSGGALGSTVFNALLVRRGDFHIAVEKLDYTPQMGEHHSLRLAASMMLAHDTSRRRSPR
jgi:hypothetical protein